MSIFISFHILFCLDYRSHRVVWISFCSLTLWTLSVRFGCLRVVPDPKADARPETIYCQWNYSWILSNRCAYQHKPCTWYFVRLLGDGSWTRCTECRGKKLAYPTRQGSDAPDSNSSWLSLKHVSMLHCCENVLASNCPICFDSEVGPLTKTWKYAACSHVLNRIVNSVLFAYPSRLQYQCSTLAKTFQEANSANLEMMEMLRRWDAGADRVGTWGYAVVEFGGLSCHCTLLCVSQMLGSITSDFSWWVILVSI